MRTILPKSGFFTFIFLVSSLVLMSTVFVSTLTIEQSYSDPTTVCTVTNTIFQSNQIIIIPLIKPSPT